MIRTLVSLLILMSVLILTGCKNSKMSIDESIEAALKEDAENRFDGRDYTEKVLGVEIEMVAVEGGTFYMGSDSPDANDDENPVHKVRLNDFYIGKYEITQAQWEAIMGDNPSYHKDCDECPVEDIEFRVQEFIDALNQVTGKSYRLPTEAEWEYAARGGANKMNSVSENGVDFLYSGSNVPGDVGWYSITSKGQTHPVGSLLPNQLGLYDMTGNVWEPVQDKYYADYYNFSVPNNPVNPAMGNYHVLRGGSWFNDAHNCRNTNRIEGYRNYGSNARGIRLAHDM